MKLHKLFPDSRAKMEAIYYYINAKTSSLGEEERQILDRCNFADNMLRNRSTDSVVLACLIEKFNISKATAYNDLVTTKYLFNSLSIEDKSYGLKLLLDINMKCLDKCILDGDYKTARDLQETRLKMLDKIQDSVDVDESSLLPPVFLIQVNTTRNGGRPKTLDYQNDIKDLDAEDIEIIQENVNRAHLPQNIVEYLKR